MTTQDDSRFWARVSGGDVATCWLWMGYRNRTGYGKFQVGGQSVLAHRYAFEAMRGTGAAELALDHLCRTRACVNPWHLEPVTQAENVRRGAPARKSHCANGHEYSPENTYMRPAKGEGRRDCRTCIRDRVRRYRQRPIQPKQSSA